MQVIIMINEYTDLTSVVTSPGGFFGLFFYVHQVFVERPGNPKCLTLGEVNACC